MQNPTGIKIIVNSQNTEKVLLDSVIEGAELISIRYFLQSSDGTDKTFIQTVIEANNITFKMEDELENLLSEGAFYIDQGQLKMKLLRPGYQEKPEEKILSTL